MALVNDEFGIYYRADLARQQVQRTRRALLWRVGWTVALVVVVLAAWFGLPAQVGGWAPWFIGSTLLVGAVLGLVELVAWLRARAEAAAVQPGLAIGLNRQGILLRSTWYPWPEVASLVVRPGRFGGSPRFTGLGRDGRRAEVLLGYTDVMPAALDSAVVALSAARARVDLSRLDA
jgi:hypothetical protein